MESFSPINIYVDKNLKKMYMVQSMWSWVTPRTNFQCQIIAVLNFSVFSFCVVYVPSSIHIHLPNIFEDKDLGVVVVSVNRVQKI